LISELVWHGTGALDAVLFLRDVEAVETALDFWNKKELETEIEDNP